LDEIRQILDKEYGLKNFELKALEGFEDITVKVACPGESYIFKRLRFSEQNLAVIEAENRVLLKLNSSRSYQFPRTIPTRNNQFYLANEEWIYRLLSYVAGDLLSEVEQTNTVLQSFGALLAIMDKELQPCYEPLVIAKENSWDLQHLNLNRPLLTHIDDPSDRNLVDYFFLQFNENVVPEAHKLRKSLLHNDANDHNVTVSEDRVTGIFDFGDLAYSWLINEVAIGLTYAMMDKEFPLQSAAEVLKGYHEVLPLEEVELHLLYYLVAARLCISLCNSAYGKKKKPESEYITISEKPAWSLLRKWIEINPLKAKAEFRKAVGYSGSFKDASNNLVERRAKILSNSLSLSYDLPIAMEGAAFQYMYDDKGETFLDAYNNIMLVGHCHPHVVRCGQRAMARLNTNTRYLYELLYTYGEALLKRFPSSLNKVFFVNSGSEATDLAIRMARTVSSKKGVLVLEQGYHGHTSIGMEISHYKYASVSGPGQGPYVVDTPMPKAFGSAYADDGACGNHFAKLAAERIDASDFEIGAFIAEPIMGCGGQVPLANGFLKEVYRKVRHQGGLCISDEVQIGFGRLGDSFWGFELHGVEPDIAVLGKPMGNGHPIGAVITTEEVARRFEQGPEFFSSFGGNPVSCAIGMGVLEVIDQENLQQRAKTVGEHLIAQLNRLQMKYPQIADVRGHGMFLGVELGEADGTPLTNFAGKIKNELRQRHILVGTDGPSDNVLKIKPPLAFSLENADLFACEFDRVMKSLQ
jgi:4-aminobutyrate aminotransferase-like enzyme/Ser/Thr protein kinase RdoA (MazF antagonist)